MIFSLVFAIEHELWAVALSTIRFGSLILWPTRASKRSSNHLMTSSALTGPCRGMTNNRESSQLWHQCDENWFACSWQHIAALHPNFEQPSFPKKAVDNIIDAIFLNFIRIGEKGIPNMIFHWPITRSIITLSFFCTGFQMGTIIYGAVGKSLSPRSGKLIVTHRVIILNRGSMPRKRTGRKWCKFSRPEFATS